MMTGSMASPTPPRREVRRVLAADDDYGIALVLILLTIVALATIGDLELGQLVTVALGGGTLLFVLHTSNARPRTIRFATIIVVIGLLSTLLAWIVGGERAGQLFAFVVGIMLAFGAPIAIAGRIRSHTVITVKTVMGALCLYLLVGLFFSYVFALVQAVAGGFFVQVSTAGTTDFVYFSYVTLATVGYGDLTASSNLGRMLAVSEALVGQLYLVSAVALLVSNLGRSRRRADGSGGPEAIDEVEPPKEWKPADDPRE